MTVLGARDVDVPRDGVAFALLGTIQDGGLPHAGCTCAACTRAHGDPSAAGLVASAAVVDRRGADRVWLIDATPDVRRQLWMLRRYLRSDARGRLHPPEGVFLTHAHMGHIAGLAHFGSTSMNTRVHVWADARLLDWLARTDPWGLDVVPHALRAGEPVTLAADVSLTPIPVPHRDETNTGTFAFRVDGPRRRLLYVPDIDSWEAWPEADRLVASVDVAVLDGCFYDEADRPVGRNALHPNVVDTLSRFAKLGARILLTHVNHTNPLLDPASSARANVDDDHLAAAGLHVDL